MKFIIATVVMVAAMLNPASADEGTPEKTEWNECFWNGVRWNAPCVYDHKHSPSPGTKSFKMFAAEDGQIQVVYITHRRAHRLLNR